MRSTHELRLAPRCRVTLHRTLRIPDDGRDYPLPPSLGAMTAHSVDPETYVVPMHRSEALWLGFDAPSWQPHALKVGIGGVDAISGETFDPTSLSATRQDYVVIPDQPWLDGINAGDGFIRQFVAVPLGEGLTVEGQLTGSEREGGLSLSLFAPVPGRFPEEEPAATRDLPVDVMACAAPMGLGAGGRMRQEIYGDEYGIDTWRSTPATTVRIDLVDALAFTALTGRAVHPPADARAYTHAGLPWFDLLEPTRRDVQAAERLATVRSIADLEGRRDEPLAIADEQVIRLLALRGEAA
jgi:hypothetical protein